MFKSRIAGKSGKRVIGNVWQPRVLNVERLENRELMAIVADLVAYRPVTNYINHALYPVADSVEADVARGPGIRMNGDDDNGNLKPDRQDTQTGTGFVDNDLVRVDVLGSGTSFNLTYGGDLAVWGSNAKSAAIPSNSNVTPGQSVWVEYVGLSHTSGTSALLLLTVNSDVSLTSATDHVVFHSFQNVVLAIGGNGQSPASFPDSKLGIFTMGGTLYNDGYDVHLFAHSDIANNGSGPAYNEVVSAVASRGVTKVAAMGYSWGGSATYFLSNALDANPTTKGKLAYTAYVDAIRRDSFIPTGSETRKPKGTAYHDNYYQRKDWLLKGNSISGANNVNVTQTSWGKGLVHTTIDDNATLQSQIVSSLMTRLVV